MGSNITALVSHYYSLLTYGHCTTIVVGLTLLKGILFCINYFRARRQFPGPPVASIWSGNLPDTMTDDIHEKWRHWHRQYGPVYQTWNSILSRVIYIGDPALISRIANSNWPKIPAQYAGFTPLSGSALFAQMDQARWKRQRKALAPAFQPVFVRDQYCSLQRHLLVLIEVIDGATETGSVINLASLHVLLTLDFVGEVAFGTELNAIRDDEDCRTLQIFRDVLPELMKCGLFPLRAKIPVLESTRQMYRSIKELRTMAHTAVSNARSWNEKAGFDSGSKRIFEILAQQRGEDGVYLFTAEELVDNYVTFLVAGGDPTAHTMTFAVNEILKKPHVLAKLRAELDEVLPSECDVPTIEQVSRLQYLHLIIKETLRYNGPGFGTFRYTPQDVEINGITTPANTILALWNPQGDRTMHRAGISLFIICSQFIGIPPYGERMQMSSIRSDGAQFRVQFPLRVPISHFRMDRENASERD